MADSILRFMGVVWYALFFGIIVPITLVLISVTLDNEVMSRWSIELGWSWLLVAAGVILLLTALFLLLISAFALHHNGKAFPWTFSPHVALNPQKLVTEGPYAVIRHPMGTSYVLYLAAIACLVPSFIMLVWMVPLCAGLLYEYFEFTEEKQLARWFGDEYLKYHQRTPSLWPKTSRLKAWIRKS